MKKKLLALTLLATSFTASANTCPDVLKFMKRKLNSQETVNMCKEFQGKNSAYRKHRKLLWIYSAV